MCILLKNYFKKPSRGGDERGNIKIRKRTIETGWQAHDGSLYYFCLPHIWLKFSLIKGILKIISLNSPSVDKETW